ncbi:MAG TPA: SIS domain-containing protein [Dictyoglomaceae bacterium]|nr:SIS domain-containing protein [Dictyoglomaceae bacterium]
MEKFMIKEIKEGVEVTASFKNRLEEFNQIGQKIIKFDPQNIVFVARGTSNHAANWGKYYIESQVGIPVSLCAPSLFTIYKLPPNLKNSVVFAISQSGESEDICEVIEVANKQGALTIGITNNPESKLSKIAQECFFLNAGIEKSVAATKTYLAQLASLYFISNALKGRKSIEEFDKIIAGMRNILEREEEIKEKVKPYKFMEHCAVLGRGFNLPTAMEAALKLKETSYVISQGYSSADFMHGPLALVSDGFPIFFFASKGESLANSIETLNILKEKGSSIFLFSNELSLAKDYDGIFIECEISEYVSPILLIYPAQFFAYHLAILKGRDPDNPRNIRKVTITK